MQKKNQNLLIYCLCLHNKLFNQVKKLNYIPVGLGKENFSSKWLRDNNGENISNKNSYYGEYSFHYWLWKNEFHNLPDNTWIGFCTYRRFWGNKKKMISSKIEEKIIQFVPSEWKNYEVILGNPQNVQGLKWMKVIKYGKKALIKNPKAIFRKNRNLKFQFDLFHGVGIIDKAINLLDEDNKEDFREYLHKNNSYNHLNMFVVRSRSLLHEYYLVIFKWLEKCEKIFGFDLKGYNKIRIYAFLAERFMPYWFNKNAKVLEWPIIFEDLNR